VGDEAQVNESILIGTALGDLHTELLDSFFAWRKNLIACEGSGMHERGLSELPALGGIKWTHISQNIRDATMDGLSDGPKDEAARLSVRLAEISTFLLVWGEAGNVRFMPEVLYFITELVLAAEQVGYPTFVADSTGNRSGYFLARVVRPIYDVVFEEWYSEVSGSGNAKDTKQLWTQLKDFLPADTGNYDDWNELFCDVKRLVPGMELRDGQQFFSVAHGDRFAALPNIDWKISLLAEATKTHREVHSLWGVFATVHRVLLVHTILFALARCIVSGDPPASPDGQPLLLGRATGIRFAAVGLVIPLHAMMWWMARWQITGPALRSDPCDVLKGKWIKVWWRQLCTERTVFEKLTFPFRRPADAVMLLPICTYALVRVMDNNDLSLSAASCGVLVVHFVVSVFCLIHLLFVPASDYMQWQLTHVRRRERFLRYLFWGGLLAIKFSLGLLILGAVDEAIKGLQLARPGVHSASTISAVYFTAHWFLAVLLWGVMWGVTFLLFLADTQLWFTLGCTILGAFTVIKQRRWNVGRLAFEDAMAKIPERFSSKVLPYATAKSDNKAKQKEAADFSIAFPAIWDRIIEYMRYEDDIDSYSMCKLIFDVKSARDQVVWEDLRKPLKEMGVLSMTKVKMPGVFRQKNSSETAFKTYCCFPDSMAPENADVQWRLAALARGLGLPMPRPFRAPYFPGITVLIPHYGEQILIQKKELFQEDASNVVPLMHWLKQKYEDEFLNFTNRMRARSIDWPISGDQWEEYTPDQWERVTSWAAMRLQTLWRTVAGMCYYHPALQCHYEAQADMRSSLARDGIWDPSDCFTCLVSMQMYKYFDKTQMEHTNRMFDKFPSCFKVAFIDSADKGDHATADSVHLCQERRYYSCLIDRTCKIDESKPYKPMFRIELPGFPILGDGKGDNQNHAIPFMRGHFSQGIDANQGAYFEQMMLLPCALGEFRSKVRGDGLSKRIVGLPEHITSDIGSIGDFAASAEVAFGTILQRTYAVLGARMHYGHPDIMNKLLMIQQGGVSKATKTINLSEDIFAGMDFTLRGNGRSIKHCEYFHLAKGRDMGFNAVLGFFSKLSSGTGEQVLSRQTFRISNVLHLPEVLSFYYAHAGYYFNQFFVSISLPLLIFIWLLVLLSDCDDTFQIFQHCQIDRTPAAELMAKFLGACFSWLMILFLVANTMPLFIELWMQRSLKAALDKFVVSIFTLSPLMFIFQAKTIGFYITNEIRFGGASYVATGRGLPTERRAIISQEKKGYEGLLLDYINIAFYDGALVLVGAVLVYFAGGTDITEEGLLNLRWTWVSLWLVVTSWLYAPFIFNPYNFRSKYFFADMGALKDFFFANRGKNWDAWYDKTVMKACTGVRLAMNDIGFFFAVLFISCWYFALNQKAEAVIVIYSEYSKYDKLSHVLVLLPPVCSSLVFCSLVALVEGCAGLTTAARQGLAKAQHNAKKQKVDRASAARQKARARMGKPNELNPEEEVVRGTSTQKMEGIPTAISAMVVMVLGIAEAIAELYPFFMWVTWKKAIIAGLILKWGLLNISVFLMENMMPSCTCSLGLPFQVWVRSHRMARDMLVSLVVVLPQLPLVLLVALNEHICPGCGAHQLLIYRDPGTVERQEKVFEVNAQEGGDVSIMISPLTLANAEPRSADAAAQPARFWGGWFSFAQPAEAPPTQSMPNVRGAASAPASSSSSAPPVQSV